MLPRLRQILGNPKSRFPEILAAMGAVLYFLQSRTYAITQISVLDEGTYLLKGYWFATGQYVPFEDYGPFLYHMPLSFLIPGYVQAWFGPGLDVGRAFAVFVSLIALLGMWLLARRWGGPWWAAGAVWALALNPAPLKIYSVAVSQGLIAAMLVWTFYLALGAERPRWQILLGSVLAGLMALTRLNMTPVLFALVLYLIWQHGWRRASLPAVAGLGVWVLGHAIYWPGILELWANHTPRILTPFLEPWRVPASAPPSWTSEASLHRRWLVFLEGLRFNFLPLAAALGAWLLWPARDAWRDEGRRRAAVFVAALFTLLLVMHAVVALGTSYCPSCFPLYVPFFGSLGLLLLLLVWPGSAAASRRRGAAALLIFLPAFIAYGVYELYANLFPPDRWVRILLLADVPRVQGLALQGGSLPLWGLLENRFGWSYAESFRLLQQSLGYFFFSLAGLLVGLALWWAATRAESFIRELTGAQIKNALQRVVLVLLVAGLLLSPTALLGGGYSSFDCGDNMIAAYERLADEFAEEIPAGSLVFWRGNRSPAPLLYLPQLTTFHAQLNGDYNYRLGGSVEELALFGLWGHAVLEDWLQQADFILIERDLYRTWLQAAIENGPYDLLTTTQPLADCSPRSEVLIYQYRPESPQ